MCTTYFALSNTRSLTQFHSTMVGPTKTSVMMSVSGVLWNDNACDDRAKQRRQLKGFHYFVALFVVAAAMAFYCFFFAFVCVSSALTDVYSYIYLAA